MAQYLKEAIKGFEEKALENGHLPFDNLSAVLDTKHKVVVEDTRDTMNKAMY